MTREQAVKCWEQIKSQLEDRSVLELGSVDEETMEELETEQIQTILGWGNLDEKQ